MRGERDYRVSHSTAAAGPSAREILSFIVVAEWRGRVCGVYYPSLSFARDAVTPMTNRARVIGRRTNGRLHDSVRQSTLPPRVRRGSMRCRRSGAVAPGIQG